MQLIIIYNIVAQLGKLDQASPVSSENTHMKFNVNLVTLAFAGAFALPSIGYANEAIEDGTPIEVIKVTGEKFDRTLQETTSSVAVYNAETIKEQNFVDLFDIINQTANVAGLFTDTEFSIRGLRNSGASNGDQTSDVSTIYLDGVFIPSTLGAGSVLNLWDTQSVEIFRGPQSTIQGRNALAGAVVLRTIDPSDEFEANGQLYFTDSNQQRASVATSIPLSNDVSFRFAADYTAEGGFANNTTLDNDEVGDAETTTLRGKLLIKPSSIEDLTIRLNASHIVVDEGDDRFEESTFPQRISLQNVEDIFETTTTLASVEVVYDVNEKLSLTSVTAYIEAEQDNSFDGDGTSFGLDEPGVSFLDDEVFSQELRLTYTGDKLEGLIGAYYFNSSSAFENDTSTLVGTDFALPDPVTIAAVFFNAIPPSAEQVLQATVLRQNLVSLVPNFEVGFRNENNDEIENFALFGEFTYDVTEQFAVTVGARYDIENIDQFVQSETIVPPFPTLGDPTLDAATGLLASQFSDVVDLEATNDFNAFLPKVVFNYKWTEDLSTSFSVQRAYRAGGLAFNSFRAALAADGDGQQVLEDAGIVNRFAPEFTNNFELSLRSQWFDKKLTVNANVFYIDYTEQQINVLLSSNPLDSLTDNVGESELKGFEIELFANPTDNLSLFANLGFTATEFTDGGDETLSATDLTGLEFNNAPRVTGGFGGRYYWDNGFYANLRVRYTDESFSIVENVPSAVNDSYTLVNFIVGYESDYYSVELFANNLLDEEYLTFNPEDPNFGSFASAGDPRIFGARVVFTY